MQKSTRTVDQQYCESVFYFLDRLARRLDTSVILTRNNLSADDERLSWTQHEDHDHWCKLIQLLVHTEVARLESLSVSGKTEVQVSLNKSASSFQRPNFDNRETASFLDMVKQPTQ